MYIDHSNNHIFICGMTRSGKTYFAVKALSQVPEGVLFFNLQNAETVKRYIQVNADDVNFNELVNLLRSGAKVDLRFPRHWKIKQIMAVIKYVSEELLNAGFNENKPIYIMYDECQTLEKEARNAVRLVATRGLYLGCRCVFITQRPALADLTFYTQSAEHYIFKLGNGEREYFKQKGINYDLCNQYWAASPDHSYCYYNGVTLECRKPI